MSRYLRPGLLPWHLLVVAVVAVFVALGLWQLDRHRQLQERNALLAGRLAAAPIGYPDAAAAFDPDAPVGSDRDASFRAVVVEGRYAPEHEVLLRGKTLESVPGYHVLTPLLTREDGEPSGVAVLVDRGWVPYELDDPELPSYAPPDGVVRIEGRLMPEADPPTGPLAGLAPRDPPEGPLRRVARADVDRLQPQMPFPLDGFVIERIRTLEPEGTGAPGALPVAAAAPAPEAGPHLSYAAQWFFFAAVAAVGYLMLLRRSVAPDAPAA